MRGCIEQGVYPWFALKVLERAVALDGDAEALGAVRRLAASMGHPLAAEARPAVGRTRPAKPDQARLSTPKADVWMASPFGLPNAAGACGFLTLKGRPCANDGRYLRERVLGCSRHLKARNPVAWDRSR